MRRLRRRLLLSLPIALAIGLFGGAPVSDTSTLTLRTRGAAQLPRTSLSEDLPSAPVDPVPSTSLAVDVAALNAQRPVEATIKTAPTEFRGAAPKRTAPPAQLNDSKVSSQSEGNGGTWAVVIGVNDYPGTANDLYSAVNDAGDVAQALRQLGVANDHILQLRDGQVTSNTVLKSVSWLASKAGPDAVAAFFFAGHVRKTPAGNEELIASDGSSVTDHQLAAALDRVKANRSWVGIAACYGLGFEEVMRPGRVLTAAAGRDEVAYENSALGRSYMVEYMIRQGVIQGRASATVQTAFGYAVTRINEERPGREPVQLDHSDGALDLRPPHANRANEPQPEPQPQPQPEPTPTSEPPASDRPPSNGSQTCTTRGLIRYCSS